MAVCIMYTVCTQQKRPHRQRPRYRKKYKQKLNSNNTNQIWKHKKNKNPGQHIRQGGVLSVIEYAHIIDEIAKEINTENIGTTTIGNTVIEGCLLWMDDMALIHKNKHEPQKMLDITDEVSKRYHIKFGKEKSQTITIWKNQEHKLKLGNMIMDNTETYKYLGITINNKGTMEDHIKKPQRQN